jgi:DnaJ-class molecular chaperone
MGVTMDMTDIANKLIGDMASAQTGVRYACVECYLCHGTGLCSWTYHDQETQEPCIACNGKKTIVVERQA